MPSRWSARSRALAVSPPLARAEAWHQIAAPADRERAAPLAAAPGPPLVADCDSRSCGPSASARVPVHAAVRWPGEQTAQVRRSQQRCRPTPNRRRSRRSPQSRPPAASAPRPHQHARTSGARARSSAVGWNRLATVRCDDPQGAAARSRRARRQGPVRRAPARGRPARRNRPRLGARESSHPIGPQLHRPGQPSALPGALPLSRTRAALRWLSPLSDQHRRELRRRRATIPSQFSLRPKAVTDFKRKWKRS